MVLAADLKREKSPISIDYPDLLPVNDQLANLKGKALDLILETPGGSGVVAHDIVSLLRSKYTDIAFIVPGWAKSAGTIMAMAADDILMEPASALGPIDAQLYSQGKVFSADAFLKGFERIKEEVKGANPLNKAYIPMLSAISPGELETAKNQLDYAKDLVTEWLEKFKFAKWSNHSKTGIAVTQEEKHIRAAEIANALCDCSQWRTHGRSIKIPDLERIGLKIIDYSKTPDLADALRRYYTLLTMTFDFGVYKVFETLTSQIYRVVQQASVQQAAKNAKKAMIELECPKCQEKLRVQANLQANVPLEDGAVAFPPASKIACPRCKNEIDLLPIRQNIETQFGKAIVF